MARVLEFDRSRGRNADFYVRLRGRLARWARKHELADGYRDYLLALPDLFHLTTRLVLDRRVPALDKALLAFAIAYVVSPFDLIPDFLGPLGFLDDLVLMVIALDSVMNRVPREVVLEHWAGDGDLLELIKSALAKADSWIGKGLVTRLRRLVAGRAQN